MSGGQFRNVALVLSRLMTSLAVRGGLLAVHQADGYSEQAGGGDGLGVRWPSAPRAAGVAVLDPQIVQGGA